MRKLFIPLLCLLFGASIHANAQSGAAPKDGTRV